MKIYFYYFCFFLCLISVHCSSDEKAINNGILAPRQLKILALGDSYTIGQGVCDKCKFPEQLKDSLLTKLPAQSTIDLQVIAQTGWTTTNLKSAISAQNPTNSFDLVTLLIGVNNQFQNRPFSLYETEFPELLNTAISLAKGNKNRVIVVSIPDYAFTPFGQSRPDPANISLQIDQYNNFAKAHCQSNNVTFVDITDITRLGLLQPNLVAVDQLHPSTLAYSKFVQRLLPFAMAKIN